MGLNAKSGKAAGIDEIPVELKKKYGITIKFMHCHLNMKEVKFLRYGLRV